MVGKVKIGRSPGPVPEKSAAPGSDAQADSNASTAGAFAAKAKDLGALREAVIDAAGVGAGLWLSYLFLFFYLFIAVAAVTHRDLLFENPVKLPFLNVELPLLGFLCAGTASVPRSLCLCVAALRNVGRQSRRLRCRTASADR